MNLHVMPEMEASREVALENYIRINGLQKKFGSFAAVDNLNLSIKQGEFVSLLGPSGCGKTTTLRMIAGFVPVTSGEIWLGGARIDHIPSHKRDAAMVFQNYALFPHMTVRENVGFGLKMQKVPKPEMQLRVTEALELVQLAHLGERFPKELSGGQQQRVALARAIVLKPKLLLLDEPLSNLDAKLRKELRSEFVKIHRLAGTTTVFVTHDLEEAFAVSDRVAVMNAGVVEQFDTPVKIFSQPRSAFVAEFVGHSNHVQGRVEAEDGSVVLRAEGTVFHPCQGVVSGKMARLAIPGHLISVSAEPTEADNCVSAKVEASSYLGATVNYELNANGTRLHAELPMHKDQRLFGVGDTVYCSWKAEDFIILPVEAL